MAMNCNIYKSLILLFVIFSVIGAVRNEPSDDDVFKSWGATEFKISRVRYTWTINNFGSYGKKLDKALNSHTFSYGTDDNCRWNLEIDPQQSVNKSDYISLSLVLLYSYGCSYINAQYKLSILNTKGEQIIVLNDTHRFEYETKKSHLIEQDLLFPKENNVQANNNLIIFCEINATNTEETSGTYKLSAPDPTLAKDLVVLLENQQFSDVTLSAQEIEFKSFKVILSARSPVFQEFFKCDPNITRIDIVDVDPNVMKETLRYIYTDEALNVDELAIQLLAAAAKYELSGLKTLCDNAIIANLTIENAADLYILGGTYSENLKIQVSNFIASHTSEISNTPGFTSMLETHPDLFVELFDSLL